MGENAKNPDPSEKSEEMSENNLEKWKESGKNLKENQVKKSEKI